MGRDSLANFSAETGLNADFPLLNGLSFFEFHKRPGDQKPVELFFKRAGGGGFVLEKKTALDLGITTLLKGTFPVPKKETSLPRSILQVLC